MIINVFIFICSQETRHINAALIQHITFNEFLPMVLGKEVMHAHDLVLLKVSNSQSIQMMVSKERVWWDISGRLLWWVRPLHQPQRSIWLHQRRLQVKKISFFPRRNFVLKRRGFGRQLNWPASQSAAFCGREILLTLQKSASTWPWRRANSFFAKKYFNPCYRFGHSLLPSTIERWSKTHRWDTRSVIRQQLLHK